MVFEILSYFVNRKRCSVSIKSDQRVRVIPIPYKRWYMRISADGPVIPSDSGLALAFTHRGNPAGCTTGLRISIMMPSSELESKTPLLSGMLDTLSMWRED
jgi:hypothetical protein